MRSVKPLIGIIGAVLLVAATGASSYPLNGYEETGIRRLEAARLAQQGELPGRKLPAGALLDVRDVDLRLLAHRDMDLPAPDPAFTAEVVALLGDTADRYGFAVLDLTDPQQPRYAEHRGDYRQNVGSVGKLVVALAIFQGLADYWPAVDDRIAVLRNTVITADDFIISDHHTVPKYDVTSGSYTRASLKQGDQATLWEFLDWMLSPSSNAAAAMLMRDAMLMRHFGADYPPPAETIAGFFDDTPREELSALFVKTFVEPLERNGFDPDQFRQASFFTRHGKRAVSGPGRSYATVRQLMLFGLRMEQGRLVDEFSSREFKRLLYMTGRRIRFASSPALRESAVYFKSGSLYSCKEEPGFKCGKYRGNARNYMNSFAIIEHPAQQPTYHYMAMVISNVLRKNSAYDHQRLATSLHELIERKDADVPTQALQLPAVEHALVR